MKKIAEKNKKIFITGGVGFIGFYLTRKLIEKGYFVTTYDAYLNYIEPEKSNYNSYLNYRLEKLRPFLDSGKLKMIRGDIRNKNEISRALTEEKPDVVVHLAALAISTASQKFSEDAMNINLNGTVNILEAIRECKTIKRFIYTSSSMVYGNFEYSPADENHPRSPLEIYGGTKKAGEVLTKVFARQFDFEYVIIRPSAVYGATDSNKRVSQLFVENALKGKPLILHNAGESKLDFSFVEDVADGFVLAIEKTNAKNETFNITRGEGRSLKELAEIVKMHIPTTKIEMRPAPKDEKRPERGALDISKAKKILGYSPKTNLEDGMKEYISFIKNFGM